MRDISSGKQYRKNKNRPERKTLGCFDSGNTQDTNFRSRIKSYVPLQKLATIRPDAVLWPVIEKMGRDGVNQLPVVVGNGIVGIVSREDILHYLQILRAFAV
jgi:predicted transcriptional regulator